MRKTYKFSSMVCQGGYLYSRKLLSGEFIEDKEGLRDALMVVAGKFKLIDVTIKIYGSVFFFFFMAKPSVVPLDVINSIQEDISSFSSWDENYVYTGVYDLQEEYVRKDLEKWGFDYDKG